MPTYEYRCDACGHKFEKFQSMTAPAIRKCPKCGKLKVQRLISAGAGIIFKGSGFYITDYRDKSYTDQAKSESAAPVTTDAKKDAKADAKTESKPETKAESRSEPKSDSKSEVKTESKSGSKSEASSGKSESKPDSKSSKKSKS